MYNINNTGIFSYLNLLNLKKIITTFLQRNAKCFNFTSAYIKKVTDIVMSLQYFVEYAFECLLKNVIYHLNRMKKM